MRWVSALIVACAAPFLANAAVTLTRQGDQFTIETASLHMVIDVHGGRIASLVNKATGADFVALWKGGGQIGGLLDDRLTWTATPYQAESLKSGPDEAAVRLSAKGPSGLAIVKTISIHGADPVVRVDYEFTNGSQQPQVLWVRNIVVPGGPPLTGHHIYIVPLKTGLSEKPFLSEFVERFTAPWTALFDTVHREGLCVAAPGAQKFYFWQGSRMFPTYEWIYPEVPPGKRLKASVALVVVNGAKPDWPALATHALNTLPTAALEDVPGWVDEATKLGVTAAQRARGFWLSTGMNDGKQRLPKTIEMDLPRDGSRAFYIGVNALKAAPKTSLSVTFTGGVSDMLQAGLETVGKDRITVEPMPGATTVDLAKGVERRVWLEAAAHGRPPGNYQGTLTLAVDKHRRVLPVRITVWPVRTPDTRPFDVRGYSSLTELTGGDTVTPETTRRLDALMAAYAGMGGSVFDWNSLPLLLARAKIEPGGESLADTLKTSPSQVALDALPHLDFSYFNPWLDVAKKHGVNRIETYLDFWDGAWQTGFLNAAVGKDRVKPHTPEGNRIIEWALREAKRYFKQRGFRGFFLKISDEMPPEDVPRYNRTAEVARAGGWRPFTTITNMIARDPKLINAMAPYCDQWQVQYFLKDDFRRITLGPNATARLKPSDEVWFYFGPSHPFRCRFEDAYAQPMLAAAQNYQGYGWWAFQFNGTEKVVWYDAASGAVRVSPAYLGLRDGWRDARLYAMAVKDRKLIPPGQALSTQKGAILRLGPVTREVYHYQAIINLDSPVAINNVRRRLLQALSDTK